MNEVRTVKNAYFDSATLMAAAQQIKREYSLRESVAVMASEANKALLNDVGLLTDDAHSATPRDLVLAVSGSENVVEAIDALHERVLSASSGGSGGSGGGSGTVVSTLEEAFSRSPESNVVLISVPGRYAAAEAHRALDAGRHVMIFSDNVSIDDEVALKKKACEKGLLMMGADCGTAIVGGAPLAFANVVRRGSIGIVAAAGTGLQEVSCLIDYYGGGVSQGLGTGGRDVKDAVGGLQMLQSSRALLNDPETDVIVLVSKPPQPNTFASILDFVRTANKPVIVSMLGGDRDAVEAAGGVFAGTLEDAARLAVAASGRTIDRDSADGITNPSTDLSDLARGLDPGRKYLRALYTGGTLCYEALILLGDKIELNSNIALSAERKLSDSFHSIGHTAVDMGEDEFTDGRPHPMIEPSLRAERFEQELADPQVAVIMLDFVLGYGSHPDPVGAMADSIRKARGVESGGPLIVASVTGTNNDPQHLDDQLRSLRSLGVQTYRSNAQALTAVESVLGSKS